MLVLLALVWGGSFMLIKVAVREIDPATLIFGRLGLAALTVAVIVVARSGARATLAELRVDWRPLVLVGIVNMAIPFWLLSWGETRIDSGLASIIQASVPIFNALLAYVFFHDERIAGRRLVGVGVGFVGVAVLVGDQPGGKILGALAVIGMAVFYAIAGLLTRRLLSETRPQIVALGTSTVATIVVAPLGLAQAPHDVPGWKTLGSVAFLGVVGTGFAFLLFYALIAGAGSAYAALVTYLVPPFALAYGAIFLHEPIGIVAVLGLALIFGGVALGTRVARPRRRVAAEAPSPA
jgi:drug/metabolite transporter (DMT)-like permease